MTPSVGGVSAAIKLVGSSSILSSKGGVKIDLSKNAEGERAYRAQ
jgi:hypothetical protein